MTDHQPSAPAVERVRAVLEGGPAGLPEASRHLFVTTDQEVIKVPYLGGYEHFERDRRPAPVYADVVRYRWVARTKVAE